MEKDLIKLFKKWCKETGRSGGVLMGSSVREFLKSLEEDTESKKEIEKLIGTLNTHLLYKDKTFSKNCQVFELQDRYIVKQENESLSFYKATLKPFIKFLK